MSTHTHTVNVALLALRNYDDMLQRQACGDRGAEAVDKARARLVEAIEATRQDSRRTGMQAIVIDDDGEEVSFQARVRPWLIACFGAEIAGDCDERNHRFVEESLELAQACGCTASEAHQLVDYVFGRPVGEKKQEVGGVMTTLAALCLAQGLDMHEAAEIELARIWTMVEKIRAKQAAKPKHSPLPEHVPAAGLTPEQLDSLMTMDFDGKTIPQVNFRRGEVRNIVRKALALMSSTAGLSVAQEPKYTVNGSAIVNRETGEAIPEDEPVFVFRARDAASVYALRFYGLCIESREPEGAHAAAVAQRVEDFGRFAARHPERMKWPDTAAAPAPVAPTPPRTNFAHDDLEGQLAVIRHRSAAREAALTPAQSSEGARNAARWEALPLVIPDDFAWVLRDVDEKLQRASPLPSEPEGGAQ